jgi:hypothetical protein
MIHIITIIIIVIRITAAIIISTRIITLLTLIEGRPIRHYHPGRRYRRIHKDNLVKIIDT